MDENNSVKKTNSGLKKKGDLEDIAEFAEEVEEVIQEEEVDEETVKDFEKWKPKKEDGQTDIEKKTVKTASISKKPVEEKSEGVKKDLEKAGSAAKDAGKKMTKKENPGPEIKKASKRAVRPVYSRTVRATRDLEERIYSNIMVKFNPYFFDSKELSADLRADKDGKYTMNVNMPNKRYRNALKKKISENN